MNTRHPHNGFSYRKIDRPVKWGTEVYREGYLFYKLGNETVIDVSATADPQDHIDTVLVPIVKKVDRKLFWEAPVFNTLMNGLGLIYEALGMVESEALVDAQREQTLIAEEEEPLELPH